MTIDEFYAKWNNKPADFDGLYGAQCVDIVNYYNRDVVKGRPFYTPSAKDWYEKFDTSPLPAYYDRIPVGNPPQKGDVVVWGKGIGDPNGHIAMFDHLNNETSFTSFDQNFPVGTVCHFQAHSFTAVYGYLRPKGVNVDYKSAWEDAERYKQAVIKSKAWRTDMIEKVELVQAVIDDLWQYKHDDLLKPDEVKPYDGPPLFIKK